MENKNSSQSTVPGTNTTKLEYTFHELGEIKQSCIVLCDFAHTTYGNCRKLFKNSEILDELLVPLYKGNQSLFNIEAELNKQVKNFIDNPDAKSNMNPIDLATKRKALEDEKETFTTKKHEVDLYTMSEADFPKDEEGAREKFGQKIVSNSNGQSFPISELTSFFYLIKSGIIIEVDL